MTQDEAIKTVDRIFNYCEEIDYHLPEEEQTGYKMLPDINAVKEYIRNTPEVVRCKDCKYKGESDDGYPMCMLFQKTKVFVELGHYCSRGERKESE